MLHRLRLPRRATIASATAALAAFIAVSAIASQPAAAADPSPAWTVCATEGQTCTVSGTRQVRYGANGTFLYRTVTDSIACTNAAFGSDPLFGVVKRCEVADDFSIQRPLRADVYPGQTVTTTISTAVTSGSAQPLSLSVSCQHKNWQELCYELPAGWSASFSPSTVTAGGASTLTVTIPQTAAYNHVYYLPIEATGPNSTRRTEFPIIVQRPACSMSTLDSYHDDYVRAHDRLGGALFEQEFELRDAASKHYEATGVVVDCLMKIVDELSDRSSSN